MRTLLVILFGASVILSCNDEPNEKSVQAELSFGAKTGSITITKDSLNIGVYGFLTKAAYFNDRFFLMFESLRVNTDRSSKKMLVFDKEGKFIEDVYLPKEVSQYYTKFIVKNDTFYIQSEWDKIVVGMNNLTTDFQSLGKRDFEVFEDSVYRVYSECNGEFGGFLIFKDKVSDSTYKAESTCPIVINKINGEYYVTNHLSHMMGFSSILKISDPTKLKTTIDTSEGYYQFINDGVVNIFDSVNFYIPTSFVVSDQLVHIYSDSTGTHLGQIENGEIYSKYKFDFNFYTTYVHDIEGGQVLYFGTGKKGEGGVLIIEEGTMRFYFINNKSETPTWKRGI